MMREWRCGFWLLMASGAGACDGCSWRLEYVEADDASGGSSGGVMEGSSGWTTGSGGTGTPVCGDGGIDPGEACDDGNSVDTDACTSACKLAACGDGFVHANVEQCDDKNTDNSDACLNVCDNATCGDGFVQAGLEACDDGNLVDTDTCTTLCADAACGDGHIQPGEGCDDANMIDTDACLPGCMPASCGDGFVQAGVEACDDGNQTELDNCRGDCTVGRRRVFVTSGLFNGNLGGLAGADGKCQMAAESGGLDNPKTFKAWLSDAGSGPANRFDTSFTGLYQLPDDTVVVKGGWQDLTDGFLEHAIEQDEKKVDGVSDVVWSNTKPDGTSAKLPDCMGWTSGSALFNGNTGVSDISVKNSAWTQDGGDVACAYAFRLYCFEDP